MYSTTWRHYTMAISSPWNTSSHPSLQAWQPTDAEATGSSKTLRSWKRSMAAGPLSSRRSVSRARSFPKGRTCSKSFSYSWSGLKQEKLDSKGKCGYPCESTLAVCSLNIPPYAPKKTYIVGTWWYKSRVLPQGYPHFPFNWHLLCRLKHQIFYQSSRRSKRASAPQVIKS